MLSYELNLPKTKKREINLFIAFFIETIIESDT